MVRWIFLVATVASPWPMQSAEVPATASTNQGARPVADRKVSPPAPLSPVEYFRQLLAMKAEERQTELARRPKTREFLESKLKEFEALTTAERDNRLRAMELQSYLRPLMNTSPTNRAEQLENVPVRDRALVEARLKLWDNLPADQQRDLLESELAVRIFYRPQNSSITFPRSSMTSTPHLERIRKSIEYLDNLPPHKRERLYANFRDLSELSEDEKTKALENVSEAERKQMELTLQAFRKLPAQQRDRCIEGFEKFRALSPAEREHFLNNAQRWDAMTQKDRQAWRSLVNRKAIPLPPAPPGFSNPPSAVIKPAELDVATNR
jgi:hypothetical protein